MSLLSTGEFQLFIIDLINNQTKTFSIYGCSVAFSKDSKIVISGGLAAPTLRYTETGEKVPMMLRLIRVTKFVERHLWNIYQPFT